MDTFFCLPLPCAPFWNFTFSPCPFQSGKVTYRQSKFYGVCENRKLLRNDVALRQLDDFLRRLVAQNSSDLTPLTSVKNETTQQRQRAIDLHSEIHSLNAEIDNMIVKESKAPDNIRDKYATQIKHASERLSTLEKELKHTESTLESPSVLRTRQTVYSELVSMGLNSFWQLAPHEINQRLHKLLGKHRFMVDTGEIIELR